MAAIESKLDDKLAASDPELTDVVAETYYDDRREPHVLLRWHSHGKLKVRQLSTLAATIVALDLAHIRRSRARDRDRYEKLYLLGVIRGGIAGEQA